MIVADTSVVVPAIATWHEAHEACRSAIAETEAIVGHVAVETFSVLTRLPEQSRLSPEITATMIARLFPGALLALSADGVRSFLSTLSRMGLVGGAVYDALVAYTALDAGASLMTRDRRALPTYAAIGVEVDFMD